jgi:hypothetical protein
MEAQGSTNAESVTGCRDFDYAPGQPNLYLMMRLKQALVAEHGRTRAFELFRERFGLAETVRLVPLPVEQERQFAHRAGLAFRETVAAGTPFTHPHLPVVGERDERLVTGVTRSQYLACLKDARLIGRSGLIEVDGRLLLDVQPHETSLVDDELEWDPLVFHREGANAWCIRRSESNAIEMDEAFTLLGAHTDFFGHWMCEYLTRYAGARLAGLEPGTPVLIDAHMPPSHREALTLLYGASCPIVEVPAFATVRIQRLWCAPAPSYMPLHEIRNARFTWDAVSAAPSILVPIVKELQQGFEATAAASRSSVSSRAIYLARKAFRHRRLTNSEQLEAIARTLGLDVVYPEDVTFAEQAALARHADLIVAPEGSSIFLTLFARPGATLCILSHPLTDYLADYAGLLTSLHIDVMAITGPITRYRESTPNDSDYSIDEEMFRRVVMDLLSRRKE